MKLAPWRIRVNTWCLKLAFGALTLSAAVIDADEVTITVGKNIPAEIPRYRIDGGEWQYLDTKAKS